MQVKINRYFTTKVSTTTYVSDFGNCFKVCTIYCQLTFRIAGNLGYNNNQFIHCNTIRKER